MASVFSPYPYQSQSLDEISQTNSNKVSSNLANHCQMVSLMDPSQHGAHGSNGGSMCHYRPSGVHASKCETLEKDSSIQLQALPHLANSLPSSVLPMQKWGAASAQNLPKDYQPERQPMPTMSSSAYSNEYYIHNSPQPLRSAAYHNNNNNHSVNEMQNQGLPNSHFPSGSFGIIPKTQNPLSQSANLTTQWQNSNNLVHCNAGNNLNKAVSDINDGNNVRANRSFMCPKCSKVFKRGDHLKRHLLCVHDRDHPYQCGECSKGFATTDSLIKHNQSSHVDITTTAHLCVRCNTRFESVLEIDRHAGVHHAEEDMDYMRKINKFSKTFSCMICHKTVSSEKNLKRHIKKLHGEHGDENHLCLKCNLAFGSISELQAHNTKVHTDEAVNSELGYFSPKIKPTAEPAITSNMDHLQGEKFLQDEKKRYAVNDNPFIKSPALTPVSGMPSFQQQFMSCSVPSQVPAVQAQPPQINNHPQAITPTTEPSNSFHSKQSATVHQQQVHEAEFKQVFDQPASSFNIQRTLVNHHSNYSISQQDQSTNKLNTPAENDFHGSVGLYCDEANTVSEAFSLAMKTLSDFSYDDLSFQSSECLQSRPSVFQSSSPLPNFHYPSAVQLAEPGITGSPLGISNASSVSNVASLPLHVPGSAASLPEAAAYSKQTQLTKPCVSQQQNFPGFINKQNLVSADQTPLNCGSGKANHPSNPVHARRGRPKKKREDEDEEEYGAQTMILKEDDNGATSNYNCTVCSEKYTGIDNLMQHVETVHLSANPHECCICNKRFAQAGNVKRHIRFVHLRERPFSCRDCDSTFDRLCYLQRHMRSHVDSKAGNVEMSHLNPCNCPECGKRCLTAHHLRGHMQRKHFAKNKGHSDVLEQKYGHLFQESDNRKNQFYSNEVNKVGKLLTKDPSANVAHSAGLITQAGVDHPSNRSASVVETGQKRDLNQISAGSNFRMSNVDPFFPSEDHRSNSANTHLKTLLESDLNCSNDMQTASNFDKQNNFNVIVDPKTTSHVFSVIHKDYTKRPVKSSTLRNHFQYKNTRKLNHILQHSHFPYKCQHCPNRNFSRLYLLKSHIAVNHHNIAQHHLCLICGRNYPLKPFLDAHIQKRHANNKFVKFCTKTSLRVQLSVVRNKELRQHSSKNKRPDLALSKGNLLSQSCLKRVSMTLPR